MREDRAIEGDMDNPEDAAWIAAFSQENQGNVLMREDFTLSGRQFIVSADRHIVRVSPGVFAVLIRYLASQGVNVADHVRPVSDGN